MNDPRQHPAALSAILGALELRAQERVIEFCDLPLGQSHSTELLTRAFPNRIDLLRHIRSRYLQTDAPRIAGVAEITAIAPGTQYGAALIAPVLKNVVADLRAFAGACRHAIRPGGYIVALGLSPFSPSRSSTAKITPELAKDFVAAFDFGQLDNEGFADVRVLIDELNEFSLLSVTPCPTLPLGCLSWYVFQKSHTATLANDIGLKTNAGAAVTGAQQSAAATHPKLRSTSLVGSIDNREIETLPLIASRSIESVLSDVRFPAVPNQILELIGNRRFDTVMFVANKLHVDPRVVKTAAAVATFGRQLLAVGLRDNTDPHEYELMTLPDGTPLLLLPNMNRQITGAMKARKLSVAEKAPRHELWLATMGLMLGSILQALPDNPDIVLHTHDYHGLYVGGLALGLADNRARYRWIHDVHEFVREYDIIDPGLQAAGTAWEEFFIRDVDHLSTVSEELAARLQDTYHLPRLPIVIYNSNPIASRHKYQGTTAKKKLGLEDKTLLVHSGTITRGRGIEHAIKALAELPSSVHLLLITESVNDYAKEMEALAKQLSISDRIHYHPYLPHDEVTGFIADVDIGLITADRYGNADVGLANKLFDYIVATVPVISSNTDAMRRFITDWPIGALFEAGNSGELKSAIEKVISTKDSYASAIASRSDLLISTTWEAQTLKLWQAYLPTKQKRGPISILSMVHNAGTTDARVMKQATALVENGNQVHLICRSMPGFEQSEESKGVNISRYDFFDRNAPVPGDILERVLSLFGPVRPIIQSKYASLRFLQESHARLQIRAAAARKDVIDCEDSTKLSQLKAAHAKLVGAFKDTDQKLKAAVASDTFFLNYFWFACRLLQLDLDLKPDVIHCHDLYPLVAAIALAQGTKAVVVFDAHEVESERTPPLSPERKNFILEMENHLLKSVDRMITVSTGCADFYRQHFHRGMPTLILNSPEISLNPGPNIRKLAGIGDDVPLMVYTGAVAKDVRGVDKIVRALEFLPDVHLAILGPRRPDFDEWLAEEIQRTNSFHRVHMLDPVPADQVVSTISHADVGVYALQNFGLACEVAFPNKLFEMTFAQLPICVSDLREMRRFVEEIGNGCIMDAADPKSIAAAVKNVLTNKSRYKLTSSSLKLLDEKYSWTAQTRSLLTLYDHIKRYLARM